MTFENANQAAITARLNLPAVRSDGESNDNIHLSISARVDFTIKLLERFTPDYEDSFIRTLYESEGKQKLASREPEEYKALLDELKNRREPIVSNLDDFLREKDAATDHQKNLRKELVNTKVAKDAGIKEDQIKFISREDLLTLLFIGAFDSSSLEKILNGDIGFNGIQANFRDESGDIKRYAFILNDLSRVRLAFTTSHEIIHLCQSLECLSDLAGDQLFRLMMEGMQVEKEVEIIHEVAHSGTEIGNALKTKVGKVNKLLRNIFGAKGSSDELSRDNIVAFRKEQLGSGYSSENSFIKTLRMKKLASEEIIDSVHSDGKDKFRKAIGANRYDAARDFVNDLETEYFYLQEGAQGDINCYIRSECKTLRNGIVLEGIFDQPNNGPEVIEKAREFTKEFIEQFEDFVTNDYFMETEESYFSDFICKKTGCGSVEDLSKALGKIAKEYITGDIDKNQLFINISKIFDPGI